LRLSGGGESHPPKRDSKKGRILGIQDEKRSQEGGSGILVGSYIEYLGGEEKTKVTRRNDPEKGTFPTGGVICNVEGGEAWGLPGGGKDKVISW